MLMNLVTQILPQWAQACLRQQTYHWFKKHESVHGRCIRGFTVQSSVKYLTYSRSKLELPIEILLRLFPSAPLNFRWPFRAFRLAAGKLENTRLSLTVGCRSIRP